MSVEFLEPEGDDIATLQEALAFIDSYDEQWSGSTSSDSASPHKTQEDATHAAQKTTKPKRKRRSKSPAGYSTKLLHRKKAEMQQLRQEAQELEMQLEQLQNARDFGAGAIALHAAHLKDAAHSKWMELAVAEYHKRQQSERTNRRLKELLRNQLKVDDALKAIVTKRSALEGMDFVFAQTPSFQGPLAATDNSQAIMAQLEQKVSEMYLDSSTLFPSETPPRISSEMKRRFDRRLGSTVEILSTAPLSCSMETASQALWKELTTIRTYPNKSYRYMQASQPNAMQKNFDQILRGKAGATPVNGLQFMRRFDEADRFVLARAYTMLLPTEGMHLGCHAWTVISRSEAEPAQKSEVRFFIQLFMEGDEGFSTRPEDIQYLRDVAFETWSLKMRGHAQFLQELLLETAAGMTQDTMNRLLSGMC